MRAGTLRHFVAIEEPTEGQNEYGEPVAAWTTVHEAWASREDLAGREFFSAQTINAEVTTRFRLRYRDGLTSKMRLKDGSTLYDIASVQDPDGRGRELIIMAARKG
jgi:SPP1 family predicted phage head-tail adaptor